MRLALQLLAPADVRWLYILNWLQIVTTYSGVAQLVVQLEQLTEVKLRFYVLPNPKKPRKNCSVCNTELKRATSTYCSQSCQITQQYENYIAKYLAGTISGTRNDGDLSHYVRKYLLKTSGNCCSECGWNKVNPVTGKIPVEIDHINGDSTNNRPENLRVLCPNCHSLTPTFRALNVGRGRKHRK